MQITEDMKTALINAGTNRQGAKVWAGNSLTMARLAGAGLIGKDCGLTRKGTIARERAVNEAQAAAFGF